jgi:hypothetical protein
VESVMGVGVETGVEMAVVGTPLETRVLEPVTLLENERVA